MSDADETVHMLMDDYLSAIMEEIASDYQDQGDLFDELSIG